VVEHIVLFKWKSGTNSQAIDAVMTALRALRSEIPGILSLSVGEDFSGRGQGYTHGLHIQFESREALDGYGPHEAHQAVVQTLINPIRDSVLAFDYEH
jgi:hypothetical protein